MALAFHQWASTDEPGEVIDVSTDAGWDLIRDRYAEPASEPLDRILEIAKAHGVQSVVIEYRYIDADWRNEHQHFYGGTFRRYPSVAHRLHFFAAPVSADFDDLGELGDLYRGYSVMRPLPGTPVGRTMIQAPPEMAGANTTTATETVNIFGHRFEITAMPFISQDAQFLRAYEDYMFITYGPEWTLGNTDTLDVAQAAFYGGYDQGRVVERIRTLPVHESPIPMRERRGDTHL